MQENNSAAINYTAVARVSGLSVRFTPEAFPHRRSSPQSASLGARGRDQRRHSLGGSPSQLGAPAWPTCRASPATGPLQASAPSPSSETMRQRFHEGASVGTSLEPGARVACAVDSEVRTVRNQVGTRLEPGIRFAPVGDPQVSPMRNQVGTRLEPGARVACAVDSEVRTARNQVGTRSEPGWNQASAWPVWHFRDATQSHPLTFLKF